MCYRRYLFLLIISVSAVAFAGENMNWPCFHGPRRDNLSAETGLLQAWPKDGPELLWTASGIGHGYSTVSIAAGRIYTAGMIDKQTYVTALDLNGRQVWQKLNGQSWQASERQTWAVPYAGSRGTPTVDGDTVYHLSELGRLTAFDAGTGRELWHVDIMKTFAAERPEYGYSESVLIDGDMVFCTPGGKDATMVALNKYTGETIWTTKGLSNLSAYCSPILSRIGEKKLLMAHDPRALGNAPITGDFDLIVYGHTHIQDIRRDGNTLVINPGHSWAVILDLDKMDYETIYLD